MKNETKHYVTRAFADPNGNRMIVPNLVEVLEEPTSSPSLSFGKELVALLIAATFDLRIEPELFLFSTNFPHIKGVIVQDETNPLPICLFDGENFHRVWDMLPDEDATQTTFH